MLFLTKSVLSLLVGVILGWASSRYFPIVGSPIVATVMAIFLGLYAVTWPFVVMAFVPYLVASLVITNQFDGFGSNGLVIYTFVTSGIYWGIYGVARFVTASDQEVQRMMVKKAK